MNILITGITGFVGTNLVNFLKTLKGTSLYGLDIINTEITGVEKIFGWDELDQLPVVDVIIHLAGKAHDTRDATEEKEYFNVNYGLTKIIYDYYLNSSSTQFYFMSSVAAVTNHVEGMLTEEIEPKPVTPYGKSKRLAESYLLANLPSGGKSVYIFRPSMIHGPGNKGNLNLLYQFIKKGVPWPLGAFTNKRSFTSIDNLIFIIHQMLDKNINSGIYQISDDEAITINDLIRMIAKAQNKRVVIWKISTKFIKFVAKIGSVLHLPLNDERLRKLTSSFVVSNKKIKTVLGISNMPINSIDGLNITLKSFQDN